MSPVGTHPRGLFLLYDAVYSPTLAGNTKDSACVEGFGADVLNFCHIDPFVPVLSNREQNGVHLCPFLKARARSRKS